MSDVNINSIGNDPERLYSELTYQEKLNFTQNIKQEVLHKLMTSGVDDTIPTDAESIASMMKIMDSMDRTTLSDKKNSVESEGTASAKELLGAMALFIKEAKNSNPFAVSDNETPIVNNSINEEVDLGDFEHDPGEAEVGVTNEEYSEFNARMESVRQEQLDKEAKELGL